MLKDQVVMDSEVYVNLFMLAFKHVTTGKTKVFEIYHDPDTGETLDTFDYDQVKEVFDTFEVVGFNTIKFDNPLIAMALAGRTTEEIKRAADMIIVQGKWVSDVEKAFNFKTLKPKREIDLIEVKVGDCSLKTLGGRMHSKRMQDLPIPPEATITRQQLDELRLYCVNDLDTTIDLLKALDGPLKMRRDMMEAYPIGISFMSLSEGQIAEATIKHTAEKNLGRRIYKPKLTSNFSFGYEPASWLKFQTPLLQNVFDVVKNATFEVDEKSKIVIPKEILDLDIKIGDLGYTLAVGGLHSTEAHRTLYADDEYIIRDADIGSMYPVCMVVCGIEPQSYQGQFLEVFGDILKQRLQAKKDKNKVLADKLKLLCNSSYGRTGSKYSTFYDAEGMLRVTLTGQLTLLQLIEMFELCGIPVISANTDGVTCRFHRSKIALYDNIIKKFENLTGFEMEVVEYKSIHNASVNSYFAVKPDGSIKQKGPYSAPGLQKNPNGYICSIAVAEFLSKGTPVEDTIRSHTDFRDFVVVRNVTGGAVKGDTYLGKAVRWYYAKGETGIIQYKKNQNKVPLSLGAKPCMTLPDEFPDDVDHDKYLKMTKKILVDIGMLPQPPKLPRKNSKEFKQLLAEGKIEENEEGKYEWVEV